MIEAGVFHHIEDRVELIEGEIFEMSPQSVPHFQLKNRLATRFQDRRGEAMVFVEPTFTIGDTVVDPDIVVMPLGAASGEIDPAQSVLIVEVAVSSLRYDLGSKAAIYARAGAPEYWVIDAEKMTAIVHRGPTPDGGWRSILRVGQDEDIVPALAPHLALRLNAL